MVAAVEMKSKWLSHIWKEILKSKEDLLPPESTRNHQNYNNLIFSRPGNNSTLKFNLFKTKVLKKDRKIEDTKWQPRETTWRKFQKFPLAHHTNWRDLCLDTYSKPGWVHQHPEAFPVQNNLSVVDQKFPVKEGSEKDATLPSSPVTSRRCQRALLTWPRRESRYS